MADKEQKKKGVVGQYNKQPVTKRKYYYDYNEVSNVETGFSDSFTELETFNTKLKDELKKEKTVKLQIHNSDKEAIKEDLINKANFLNNVSLAKNEYKNYKKSKGKEQTLSDFMEVTTELVKEGYKIYTGGDVAKAEAGNINMFESVK